MNEISNKELLQIRRRFIDVSKSFFIDEPDPEKMSRWRGLFTALSREQINPYLDTAVKELHSQINSKHLEELKNEYYKLFIDPYDRDRIQLDASFHLDGRSYGMTLAQFRGYLQEKNLIKEDSCTEPEDSLVVMLDVLETLVLEEKAGHENAQEAQATLMQDYLEPFAKVLSTVFDNNPTADFYSSCIKFLRGYLDLEKGLIGEAVL